MEIGVALIRKMDRRIHWLGKFDRANNQIDFVIAHRLEKESWRESIIREVAWELDIDRKRDFIVSNMAQLNINLEATLPGQLEPVSVACAFYNVELYRKSAIEQIDGNADLVWLSSSEICNGVTDNGTPLNPLVVLLNEEADVIQHWESDATGE